MKHFSFTVLLAALAAGCAHYRGAGSYRTGADYQSRSPARGATPVAGAPNPIDSGGTGPFRVAWPVVDVRLTRGFRPWSDRNHQGLDLGGAKGTPILAAHDGVVVYAGHQFHGYGNMVLLEFDGQWASLYGHLDRIHVREGLRIRAGDLLGYMGRTGRATGVHLHFELMEHRRPVDATALLPTLTRGLAGR